MGLKISFEWIMYIIATLLIFVVLFMVQNGLSRGTPVGVIS